LNRICAPLAQGTSKLAPNSSMTADFLKVKANPCGLDSQIAQTSVLETTGFKRCFQLLTTALYLAPQFVPQRLGTNQAVQPTSLVLDIYS
jgi:hypothetical protein